MLHEFLNHVRRLLAPIMFYAVTERTCGADPGSFTAAEDCNDENARIVAVAYFDASLDVSTWDANTATEWAALVTAADLKIVKPVTGQLPRPTANTAPADGFQAERKKNHSYDIPIHHYGVDANLAFYQAISDQPGKWSAMIVFEDLTGYLFLGKNLKPVPMMIDAGPASETEELGDNRMMQVNLRFKNKQLPYVLPDLPAATFA